MGHQVSIIENIPHITPVKSRVEAIVKLDPPKSPKNCKHSCGMVNYLSMFLKDLQTKLTNISPDQERCTFPLERVTTESF